MRYVVDASVAIRWYLKKLSHPNAVAVLRLIIDDPGLFAVPELFAYETLAVLYRHHPYAPTVFRDDVDRLLRSGILRYPMTANIYGRMDRFNRMGLSAYDAVYVALAEEIGGKWLTFDSKAHEVISEEKLSIDLSKTGHYFLPSLKRMEK